MKDGWFKSIRKLFCRVMHKLVAYRPLAGAPVSQYRDVRFPMRKYCQADNGSVTSNSDAARLTAGADADKTLENSKCKKPKRTKQDRTRRLSRLAAFTRTIHPGASGRARDSTQSRSDSKRHLLGLPKELCCAFHD